MTELDVKIKSKCKVAPEILSSKIDEEVVLMSIETGTYYSLDPIGSRIWELLSKEPETIPELVDQLMEEYDVEVERCITDVQVFIDDMASKKLVTEVKR